MKKTVRSFPADGLRRELPIFHLRFVGAVCGQCAGGAGAFVYIWKILRDVLNAAPNYAQAVNIPHYGWMAVLFAVLAYIIYIAALMCSHLSAFRVATNLRLEVSEHLATLPLGFTETFGSGKLRKIIHESTGAAETFLAHQLPDKYNAMATPIGLLVLCLCSTGGWVC